MRRKRRAIAVVLLLALGAGLWLALRESGDPPGVGADAMEDAVDEPEPEVAVPAPGLAGAPAIRRAAGTTLSGATHSKFVGATIDVDVDLPAGEEWRDELWVVLARADGKTITAVQKPSEGGPYGYNVPWRGLVMSRRDSADGVVAIRIEGVPRGSYTALASFGSMGNARVQSAPVDLEIAPPSASVRLRLASADRLPTVEAIVRQASQEIRAFVGAYHRGAYVAGGRTSPGTALPWRVPADVDLEARVLSYDASTELGLPPPKRFRVSEGGPARVEFDVPPGAPIALRFLDEARTPLPDRSWSLWRLAPPAAPRQIEPRVGQSDFGLNFGKPRNPDPDPLPLRIAAGRYGVRVEAAGEFGYAWQEFDATEGIESTVAVLLSRGQGRPAVALESADGKPVYRASAFVSLERATGPAESVRAGGSTDDQGHGRVEFPPLASGDYLLTVTVGSTRFERRVVVRGGVMEPGTVRLPDAAETVSGRVTGHLTWKLPGQDQPTAPPTVLDVRVTPTSGEWSFSVLPELDGSFALDAIPAGTFRLTVVPTGTFAVPIAPYESGLLTLRAGETLRHDVFLATR